MSGANRGAGGAAASEHHNQENMLSRLRGPLKNRAAAPENQENLAPKQAATRTVLGALQNNQRSKAQNQRGTKQVRMLGGSASSCCYCLLMITVAIRCHRGVYGVNTLQLSGNQLILDTADPLPVTCIHSFPLMCRFKCSFYRTTATSGNQVVRHFNVTYCAPFTFCCSIIVCVCESRLWDRNNQSVFK